MRCHIILVPACVHVYICVCAHKRMKMRMKLWQKTWPIQPIHHSCKVKKHSFINILLWYWHLVGYVILQLRKDENLMELMGGGILRPSFLMCMSWLVVIMNSTPDSGGARNIFGLYIGYPIKERNLFLQYRAWTLKVNPLYSQQK